MKKIKNVCLDCGKRHGRIPRMPIWCNHGRCDICGAVGSVTSARNYHIGGEDGEKS
jgi:hypothetical protein